MGGDDTRIKTFTANYDCEATITVTIARGDRTWQELLSHLYVVAIRSTDGQNIGWSYNDFDPDTEDSQQTQQITCRIALGAGAYEIEVDLPASTYPTGYLEAYLSFLQPAEKPMYSKGCGFRVKSIKHYNSKNDTSPVLSTNYLYVNPVSNNSSGVLFDYLSFVNTQGISYAYWEHDHCFPPFYSDILYTAQLDIHYISGNNEVSNAYGMNSGVGYSYVKEMQVGQNTGSILFEYHNHKVFYWQHEFISEADEPLIDSYPVLNGKTKSITFYNTNDNVARKESYFFNARKGARFLNINTFNRYNKDISIFIEGRGSDCCTYIPHDYIGYIDLESTDDASVHVEEIFSHNITLERKELEVDGVLTTDSFTYNDQLLLTRRESGTSNGNVKKYTYKYPGDINQSIYASMFQKNLLDYPIEESIKINESWTNSKLTTYKTDDGNYVPDKVYTVETTTPLTSFTDYNGSSPDANYGDIPEIEFLDYDGKGNLLKSRGKNGIYTYYLWAYNSQYMVAKIESSANTTISVTVNDNNLSKSDEFNAINNDVLYLKGLLTSYISNDDYMVTLYTYKPLWGMTSQTNPNGVTTYYEYDSFGRLRCTKDDDGNILKQYDYHYSNQY